MIEKNLGKIDRFFVLERGVNSLLLFQQILYRYVLLSFTYFVLNFFSFLFLFLCSRFVTLQKAGLPPLYFRHLCCGLVCRYFCMKGYLEEYVTYYDVRHVSNIFKTGENYVRAGKLVWGCHMAWFLTCTAKHFRTLNLERSYLQPTTLTERFKTSC